MGGCLRDELALEAAVEVALGADHHVGDAEALGLLRPARVPLGHLVVDGVDGVDDHARALDAARELLDVAVVDPRLVRDRVKVRVRARARGKVRVRVRARVRVSKHGPPRALLSAAPLKRLHTSTPPGA